MFRKTWSMQTARALGWQAAVAIVVAAIMLAGSPAAFGQAQILDVHEGLPDFDARTGAVAPTTQQLAVTSNLGASAVWNRFGTPASLIKHGGFLATGMQGDEVTVARNFISANRALFRLSDQGLANLELLNDQKMASGSGHAVLFRQRFGTLPAAQDGMITVGVTGDKVAYVSSSSAGDQAAPGAARLTPLNAWLNAASNVSRVVTSANVKNVRDERGWTTFDVPGFSHPQRVRLVALPTPTSGVRPAYETIVLDVQGGHSTAYTHFVDAQNGRVLFRQNRVYRLAESQIFQGSYQDAPAPPLCGPPHNFVVPAGKTSITVTASAAIVTNDIVLKLILPDTTTIESDTATSPEAIRYAPGGGVPAGTYTVLVCPFTPPTAPATPPYNYVGTFTTDDTPLPQAGIPYPPKWKVFPANPPLDHSNLDNRQLWCWVSDITGVPVAGCERELKNLAARGPWDYNFRTNTPTFTTIGNAAIAGEAWLSPLTPAEQYRPVSPQRNYDFPWTNSWFRNNCAPTAFSPDPVIGNRNDIDAATTNLFAMHNRLHDWSYFLGFTEENYNAQENNFGNRASGGVVNDLTGGEFDPEVGNSQAGALTGGQPSLLGRDNANQISLQDGIPGITNMYLWQPIAAAFYPPCVDGDYDMAVIGHEYAHLITGRMVGGPDANPTGAQGGAMNESWSDQQAAEYLAEHNFVPTSDENPFAVGAYVTGNKETGIRNYGMNRNLKPPFNNGHQQNPLNYGNVGYDVTGPQVHADGEIWSATGYRIRQAFVEKYNALGFPASDASLQLRCADGAANSTGAPLDASVCPGNRRWIQILYDAYLLQQADTSMITARNAYLAADVMRFGGANQDILWREFARSGLGEFATTNGSDDSDPKPNFESAVESNEATITFDPRAFNERTHFDDASGALPVPAKIYVGHYEARSTPIADGDGSTPLSATAKFVPGTYDFVAVAPGYGHFRFTQTLTAGESRTLVVWMPTNYASITKGGVASGDGVSHNLLIDDTEATNWGSLGSPVQGKQVTVKLGSVSTPFVTDPATNLHTVGRVQVSAMLRTPPAAGDPQDTGTQSRFAALRQFKILTCTESLTNPNCVNPLGFTEIFTSAPEAFPASVPRPNAPDLIIRSFDVPDTQATHVRIQVVTNQCTGQSEYHVEDADPLNTSDCRTSARANDVRIAELQVFDDVGGTGTPQDPLVTLTMTAPARVRAGSPINYDLTYFNAGPAPSQSARITSVLPPGLTFVAASNGGVYDPASRQVTWDLGTVPVTFSRTIRLTAHVPATIRSGTAILNQATFTGQLTVSPPTAVATTLVGL